MFDRYEVEQPGYRTKLMDKCFETDLSYGKIYTKVCKGEDSLFKGVRAKLREHYEDIVNVFIFLACRDDRACIGLNEFTSWISAISACDKALDMALVDRTFISTNIHDHSFFLNADRTLYRYEFLEIIVRLAKIKYNEGEKERRVKTLPEAIELFLAKQIYPNCRAASGLNFRQQHLYNTRVNELLKKNEPVIKRIWTTRDSIIHYHPKKRFITITECRSYVKAMGLSRLSDSMIGMCYYESMVMIPDNIKNMRQEEMSTYEFLVFMCRITFEHYKASHYHTEKMYIKLEKMLPNWLAPVYAIPEFGFNNEFDYDLKMARKKRKQIRRAANLSSEEEEGFDDMDDSDEEEEVEV